jgi:hypothetical protein
VHRPHELEAGRVIRSLLRRLGGGDAEDPAALRAEIDRLRAQNESMKRAMRQCIDCEYRIEVMASRAERGLNADGSAPAGRVPGAADD